jgi:uncharacterized membrane protein
LLDGDICKLVNSPGPSNLLKYLKSFKSKQVELAAFPSSYDNPKYVALLKWLSEYLKFTYTFDVFYTRAISPIR